MGKEIIVKFKDKDSWAQVYKYKNCYDFVGPYLTRAGNIYTGLNPEDARRLEKRLGFRDGYLDPSSEYWSSFAPKIGTRDMLLRPDDSPEDELMFLFFKGHKNVQYGLKNENPAAKYIMVDHEAEIEQENTRMRIRRDAVREFDKMSLDEMRRCLRLYGISTATMSNEWVENTLYKLVEDDPKRYLDRWINNKLRDTEFLIERAIEQNVIRRQKNVYYFGTDIIGNSMQDAIDYLRNPKNKDLKSAIEVEADTKANT